MSALTWNEEFELRTVSNSVSYIQNQFEYVFKNYGEENDNPSIRIYVN